MPAGVSWPTYLKFASVAFLFMFAGSHSVHLYYRPLNDLEEIVKAEEAARLRQKQEAAAKQTSTSLQ